MFSTHLKFTKSEFICKNYDLNTQWVIILLCFLSGFNSNHAKYKNIIAIFIKQHKYVQSKLDWDVMIVYNYF